VRSHNAGRAHLPPPVERERVTQAAVAAVVSNSVGGAPQSGFDRAQRFILSGRCGHGEARELAEQAKAFDEWNLAEERRVDLLNDVDRPRGKPGASPRDLEPSCTRVRGVDLALDQVLSFQASHHLGSHLDVGTCELGEGFRATEEVCKLRWQESETTTLPTTEERQALMGGVDDEIDLRPVQLVP
jgi:hypothetical protein